MNRETIEQWLGLSKKMPEFTKKKKKSMELPTSAELEVSRVKRNRPKSSTSGLRLNQMKDFSNKYGGK